MLPRLQDIIFFLNSSKKLLRLKSDGSFAQIGSSFICSGFLKGVRLFQFKRYTEIGNSLKMG